MQNCEDLSSHAMWRTDLFNTTISDRFRVSDTGLQLRIASERGKRNEVKQLIAAGAPVTQDSVSECDKLGKQPHVYLRSSAERLECSPQSSEVWPQQRYQRTGTVEAIQHQHAR